MNIWTMSGAELSREISQPAPITVLRGNGGLADQIMALSPGDRAALLRMLKPEVKRIGGGSSFKDAYSFFVAFNAAREACRAVHGAAWYLDVSACLKARVPAAWVALRGEQGIWRSPRDVNFPRGEFWPGGVLPVGPEYAEHGPVAKVGGAQVKRRRAVAFVLEAPPDGEMETREAA